MPIFAAATMRAIATITVAICSHSWLFSLDERGPQSLGLEKTKPDTTKSRIHQSKEM